MEVAGKMVDEIACGDEMRWSANHGCGNVISIAPLSQTWDERVLFIIALLGIHRCTFILYVNIFRHIHGAIVRSAKQKHNYLTKKW